MNLETQWTVYRTRFLVRAQQLTEPLVFTDALGREQSGQPGDYLVETSEGIKRITTRALFEDIRTYRSITDHRARSPSPYQETHPKIAPVPPRKTRVQGFKT
jgi:hypothetical protein